MKPLFSLGIFVHDCYLILRSQMTKSLNSIYILRGIVDTHQKYNFFFLTFSRSVLCLVFKVLQRRDSLTIKLIIFLLLLLLLFIPIYHYTNFL